MLFSWFTNAATVLDRPEPGVPATRMRPNSESEIEVSAGGNPSDSKVGSTSGMTRSTIMKLERCLRRLSRKRPMPGALHGPE